MDFNSFFQSKGFKITTWALAGLVVLLLVFRLGIAVGYKKAGFSYRWGENYHRNFGGPRGGFAGDFFDERTFIESHGVFGEVVSVDGNTIVVKGRDNVEKIVQVKDDTVVIRFREEITAADLKPSDSIVVIGDPNDAGQIEAKLIRLMPARPAGGPPPGTMMFRR